MAKQIGFKANNTGDIYAYFENGAGGSCAIGQNFADSSKLKIVMSDSVIGLTPSGTAQLTIDPTPNGDITITPLGAGDLIVSSLTTGVVQADSIGTLSSSNGTDGQVLIAATAGIPFWGNLTPGTGITITNAANAVTINSSGGGMSWVNDTVGGSFIQMVASTGYIANAPLTSGFRLPLNPVVGDVVEVVTAIGTCTILGIAPTVTIQGMGLSGKTQMQGSLLLFDDYVAVKFLCVATSGGNNDTWQIISMVGNWDII